MNYIWSNVKKRNPEKERKKKEIHFIFWKKKKSCIQSKIRSCLFANSHTRLLHTQKRELQTFQKNPTAERIINVHFAQSVLIAVWYKYTSSFLVFFLLLKHLSGNQANHQQTCFHCVQNLQEIEHVNNHANNIRSNKCQMVNKLNTSNNLNEYH